MKKVIIRVNATLPRDELCRIEEQIKRDLDKTGLIVLDAHYDVYIIEDDE